MGADLISYLLLPADPEQHPSLHPMVRTRRLSSKVYRPAAPSSSGGGKTGILSHKRGMFLILNSFVSVSNGIKSL